MTLLESQLNSRRVFMARNFLVGGPLGEKLVAKPTQPPSMEGVEDLQPTPEGSSRTWTWMVFAGAWASMMVNAATFSSGAALLSLGLSVPETLMASAVGCALLVVGLVLNAAAGVKYGIPFPVLARSSFGSAGAHFCTLSRGAVAIMWLSFMCWQGALGIYTGLEKIVGKGWLESYPLGNRLNLAQLVILLLYLMVHAILIQLGPARLKKCIYLILPVVVLGLIAIAIWAGSLAPFFDAMSAAEESAPPIIGSKAVAFMAAVNSSVGAWSTLMLNVCDLSRFSPTQKDQVLGQTVGIPIPYLLTLFIGMWIAGATAMAYGKAIWQVPECFAFWDKGLGLLGGVLLAVSNLIVNLLANIISPINDLMNVAPERLTYRGCGFVVLILSIAVCPWWTFSGKVSFVLNFLSGYAMLTGAIAGVFIADYWILRQRCLDLQELYSPTGVNWRAILAVFLGAAPCVPGFINALLVHGVGQPNLVSPFWAHLYSGGSCLFSLAVAGTFYLILSATGTQKISAESKDLVQMQGL